MISPSIEQAEKCAKRTVKLGRKIIPPFLIVAYHWAIRVGTEWYEIGIVNDVGDVAGIKDLVTLNTYNIIKTTGERYAKSCAGAFGGEIIGVTNKKDDEIQEWCETWKKDNPDYNALKGNCQKFSFEFIEWLTAGNYRCAHRVNAGAIQKQRSSVVTVSWLLLAATMVQSAFFVLLYLFQFRYPTWIYLTSVWVCYCVAYGSLSGVLVIWTKTRIQSRTAAVMLVGLVVFMFGMGLIVHLFTDVYRDQAWLGDVLLISAGLGIASGVATCSMVCVVMCYQRGEVFYKRHKQRAFAVSWQDGSAVASYGLAQKHVSTGLSNFKYEVLVLTAQAVAGRPGLGVFVDAILADTSFSFSGNLIGVRHGCNVNTGVGVRNANFEAHLLGFGGKIGADGVEVNTPAFGVNLCTIL